MESGLNSDTQQVEVLPEDIVSVPVFVDSTGKRGRRFRTLGFIGGGIAVAYSAMLGLSFVGGPLTPNSLLPLPGVPSTAPLERAAEPNTSVSPASDGQLTRGDDGKLKIGSTSTPAPGTSVSVKPGTPSPSASGKTPPAPPVTGGPTTTPPAPPSSSPPAPPSSSPPAPPSSSPPPVNDPPPVSQSPPVVPQESNTTPVAGGTGAGSGSTAPGAGGGGAENDPPPADGTSPSSSTES
ncbi:hypothetical protein [Cryptosporangium sp. NPDC051539]|uniref:hypothetical protein n=1 Tax=Cryptosporangium sp. NPDC051539 TaxID=3363962 RepID=UPI003790542F